MDAQWFISNMLNVNKCVQHVELFDLFNVFNSYSMYPTYPIYVLAYSKCSMHIKFLEAQTAYRIIKYVDGQVSPKQVFTPKHGATRAPFVHLTTKTS